MICARRPPEILHPLLTFSMHKEANGPFFIECANRSGQLTA